MSEYDEYLMDADPVDEYLIDAPVTAVASAAELSDRRLELNIEEQKQAEYLNAIHVMNSRIETDMTARQYSKGFSLNT